MFQYGPELILVAAGFDAGSGDPMVNYLHIHIAQTVAGQSY